MRIPRSVILWWSGFSIVVITAFSGLFVITKLVLQSEASESEAHRVAALSEDLRIALWRLDTALSPLIAQENLIPPETFLEAPIDSAPAIQDNDYLTSTAGELFSNARFPIVDRFEWFEDSNQWKTAKSMIDSLDDSLLSSIRIYEVERGSLRHANPNELMRSNVSSIASGDANGIRREAATQSSNDAVNVFNRDVSNQKDYQQRQQNSTFGNYLAIENTFKVANSLRTMQPMFPVWHNDRLLLVRTMKESGATRIQGSQIELRKLGAQMKGLLSDLFPEIDIVPINETKMRAEQPYDDFARLASLPFRLEPVSANALPNRHSIRPTTFYTLMVAWLAALVATLAAGISLATFQQINRRRTLFVSSVTHELRTPLTTFQLYTDLLTRGFITDESQRKSYLETLRGEAFRLQHLVENILAFSRIERGRASPETAIVRLSQMIEHVEQRIAISAQRGGLEVVWKCDDHANTLVSCNVDLVEQILLNLVDNACKYASSAIDRRVIISSSLENKRLRLSVRDFGPGFERSARWWKPFSKSAEQAAESAPGIGLGLALSRSLARQFSAQLLVDPIKNGAQVTLSMEMIDDSH